MDVTRIFKKGIEKIKPDDINESYLDTLAQKAETQWSNISKNFETIEMMVNGDQWNAKIRLVSQDTDRLWDSQGNELYALKSYLSKYDDIRPQRIYNLIKPVLDTQASIFSEVQPRITAVKKNPFDEVDLSRVNLLFDTVQVEENNIDQDYYLWNNKAMEFGYCFVQVAVDYENAKTSVPIKWKYLAPHIVRVDPRAESWGDVQYLFINEEMEYEQIEDMGYKYDGRDNEKPKYYDQCKIEKWWVKVTPESNRKRARWICFYRYNNQTIIPKGSSYIVNDKGGEAKKLMTYDTLPIVLWSSGKTDKWYASSIVEPAIEPQCEINKAKSEQTWNWAKFIDPPVLTEGYDNHEEVVQQNIPGGILAKAPNQNFQYTKIDLASQGDFDTRIQALKDELSVVLGNIDIMTGRRPTGTYSAKMLETLQKISEVRSRFMEECFLNSLKMLGETTLAVFLDVFGRVGVTVYSPVEGELVRIGREDVDLVLYSLKIETKDANLMSPQAKFELINQLMQYGNAQELVGLYYIMLMFEDAMPGLIPAAVLEKAKAMVGQAPQQGQAMTGEAMAQGQAVEEPAMEIDDETLRNFIAEKYDELMNAGVPQESITDQFSAIMKVQPQQMAEYLQGGEYPSEFPKDDVMNQIEIAVSQISNINARS